VSELANEQFNAASSSHGAERSEANAVSEAVRGAAFEVEAHVAESGWDQPVRLYALVPTSELIADEPELAARLGLDAAGAAGTFTPIEQEVDSSETLERLLPRIEWPAAVRGAAAVVERLVLPGDVEADLPAEAEPDAVAEHPGRREIRIAAAATRDGRSYCVVRLRGADHDDEILDGDDLVPGLVGLLVRSLTD
jgi:hypothetical protein